MLQAIHQQKTKEDIMNERAMSYQNIYNILSDNVKKAKENMAHLGEEGDSRLDEETDRRILRQKQEFENLLREYMQESKAREQQHERVSKIQEKQQKRDDKIQRIREHKFEEELINQQRSLMFKRDAQQYRLCQQVCKLASNLEKNKLL